MLSDIEKVCRMSLAILSVQLLNWLPRESVRDMQSCPTPTSSSLSHSKILALNSSAVALISSLGRKMGTKSNDLPESTFLFQRLAITLQRFNSVLQESFVSDPDK